MSVDACLMRHFAWSMTGCIAVDRCRCNDMRPNCGHIIKPLAIRRRSPNTSECTVLCPANRPFRSSRTWLRRGPAVPVARRSVCNNAIANWADLRSPTAAAAALNRPASRRLFCCQLEVLAQRIRSISTDHSSLFLFPLFLPFFFFFFFPFFSRGIFGEENGLPVGRWKGPKGAALLCVVMRECLVGEVTN